MINCYRDKEGRRSVDPNGLHPLIATFLEQDVQSGPRGCQELLNTIDEIENGRRLEWSGTYNAHAVTIRPDGVVIENLWSDSFGVAHLPLEVFRGCIKAWAAFFSS